MLTASAGLARDKGLRSGVAKNLQAGQGPVAAVQGAVEQFVTIFTNMGGLMAERVTDLRDIERRVVAHLVGEPAPGVPTPSVPSILVAEDLAPSDTSGLDPELVTALVTERGGATSHTAIIARQLGIPCVVGAAGIMDVPAGAFVVVDGEAGTIEQGADPEEARARVEESRRLREELASWSGPASTSDGMPVKLLANVADGASAESAGVEPVGGVGLFRTELCFLDQKEEPTVEEQAEIYGAVLAPYADGRYVVVRTLDAGSDKPIAFATHEGEENPALGVRGLRLSFGNPGLMDRQLDGIAAAAEKTGTETWVMAPMVATVAEAADFAAKVRARGLKAGVMVEIPSAALLAHRMLEVVDFLSIGTNDLTQYAMAADRMATDLAHLTDPWQPAVLQLIAITAHAGTEAGKPVGRLRRGRGRPAARHGADRDGHHVPVDGRPRRTPRRCPALPGLLRDLRGRRRGRPRCSRPDGRPRRGPRAARALRPASMNSSPPSGEISLGRSASWPVALVMSLEALSTSRRRKHDISVRPVPRGRSRPAGRSLGLEPVGRGRGEHGQG